MTVKKEFKVILFILAFIVMAFSFYRMFTKPGLDVKNVPAEAKISWIELVNSFENDEIKASELYVDKVIEVSGTVIDISESEKSRVIVLGDKNRSVSVICQFQENEFEDSSKVKIGDSLVVKGFCTGYLMDVMLIRSKIIKFQS